MRFAPRLFAVENLKDTVKKAAQTDTPSGPPATAPTPRRRRWQRAALAIVILLSLLVVLRAALPTAMRWYVNRQIDQSPLYDGAIGDVDLHLWRGAYSIEEIRLNKTTGNLPVPLFAAKRVDFSLQWNALARGRLVGRMLLEQPQINFVDARDESRAQTGVGGPWLEIIRDLFPFKINSAVCRDGAIHFRAIDTDPPVDVYLGSVQGRIENLTNINDALTPLSATVSARALAMDHAKVEYEMKLNPFSYRPTFQLAVRMLGLDVAKINALARAYGNFSFEAGWFDLVIEADAKEGGIEGYVKPLFRNVEVVNVAKDASQGNLPQLFWEALVGAATEIFKNQRRDQFGTRIRFHGDVRNPRTNLLEVIGNVLRNAFVRAYLPRLRHVAPDINELQFDPGEISDEPVLSQD
jgi:Domain of Unknown Function (DUF748)